MAHLGKPSMVEQVKHKVTKVKDQVLGHGHPTTGTTGLTGMHNSPMGHGTTTVDKVKDAVTPGTHHTTGLGHQSIGTKVKNMLPGHHKTTGL